MALQKKQIIHQPENCLNRKKPFARECRICMERCPHHAIGEEKEISQNACTECGVCVACCPSDGFVDTDMDSLGQYLFDMDKVTLNCPVAQPLGQEIPCLGMLDQDAWLTILLLAERKPVRVLVGNCNECDDRKACAVSVEGLNTVLQHWNRQMPFRIEVLPQSEEEENGEQSLTANEKSLRTSASIRQNGKKVMKKIISNLDDRPDAYQTPKSRQWLARALEEQSETKVSYPLMKADDKCTGCGVCTKICPQQSLQQITKDGIIKLIFEPLDCVLCGRCIEICGPQALRLDYTDLNNKLLNGKILINETKTRFCGSCGKQIFHDKEPQLCLPCAAKNPEWKGLLY